MSLYTKGAGSTPAPFFIALCMMVMVARVQAQPPVVEIEDRQAVTPVQATTPPASSSARFPAAVPASAPASSRQNQLADLFIQMQQLQQEVQALRGTVEQQSYEIETLKQQRKDDYVDLDRRISTLQAGATTVAPTMAVTPSLDATAPVAAGAEKDSYDAAYQLLDQNRKDEAVLAFTRHINRFPDGEYTGNAYYWLGLIQSTQGQLTAAQEHFQLLLKKFPDHRKVPDARFALGKVYFQQGKRAEARKIIQEVAEGNSSAAAPAKAFLQANF